MSYGPVGQNPMSAEVRKEGREHIQSDRGWLSVGESSSWWFMFSVPVFLPRGESFVRATVRGVTCS